MNNETWIVFKAESMDAPGWEQRRLMPSGGLTDLLAEYWDCSGQMPQVGDRVRDYANLDDPGNGITHGRDADWIVERIKNFTDTSTGDRVVICFCSYAPIPQGWELLGRGVSSEKLLTHS